MVFKGNKSRKPIDVTAARELGIYIDNDYDIYKRKSALMANYNRRFKKGRFNPSLAERGVLNNVVIPAARKYDREFGSGGQSIFAKAERQATAKAQLRQIFRDLKDNKWEWKA